VEGSTAALEGMLEHIYRVRDASDLRDSADKKKDSTATRTLYHKLLFYKRFVILNRPLILTEGPTDSIYLRAAIEHLTAYHPSLAEIIDGRPRFEVDFLRYSRRTHDILQLGGGTGDLKHLIIDYKDNVLRYGHRPLRHPVIMLVDNDDGADPIMKTARNFGAAGISLSTTAPFYRLDANLYLVKTPEFGHNNQSCIEDLFPAALLQTPLDGKLFDKSKAHGDATSYGKVRFAEKVVSPNRTTIDFSGFAPLLDRIVAVIDDYKNAAPWKS
jgi:RNA-directed DNA polymerase